jgi:hypothetical protein
MRLRIAARLDELFAAGAVVDVVRAEALPTTTSASRTAKTNASRGIAGVWAVGRLEGMVTMNHGSAPTASALPDGCAKGLTGAGPGRHGARIVRKHMCPAQDRK